jgi:predicted carbohydrate-binding protein with CBM5 and CBM33 domain
MPERRTAIRRRAALALAATALAPLVIALMPPSPASAHGSMSDPASRVYTCWKEGPDSPDTAACQAAVAASGTQAFYDWNEVSLLEAGGRHQQLIPDGQLCSAGRAKYRGLDLARSDWPAKKISAGPQQLAYHATAPHLYGTFTFYITKSGWSPTSTLRWADLEKIGDWTGTNPPWNWTVNVPSRSGRALIYSIWQRYNGSNEAFYTCSDVDFGGGNPDPKPQPNPQPSTPRPSPSTAQPPNPQPSPNVPDGGGTWAAGTTYATGQTVTYGGKVYTCRQGHGALAGWEPPNVPALWLAA